MPDPDDRLPAASIRFEPVDPGHADATWALAQYFAKLDRRFPTGFDPNAHPTDDDDALRPPAGVFLVVYAGDRAVGCGAVQRLDRRTGEIKRMWIADQQRGHGLGRRLLVELERQAARLGYQQVKLDTNSELVEARSMYASSGYEEIDRYNDNPYAFHWFAKELDPPRS